MGDGLVKGDGVLIFRQDHHCPAAAYLKLVIPLFQRHKGGCRLTAAFQRQAQLSTGRNGGGGVENIKHILIIRMNPASVDSKISGNKIYILSRIGPLGVGIPTLGALKTADVVVVIVGIGHAAKTTGQTFASWVMLRHFSDDCSVWERP